MTIVDGTWFVEEFNDAFTMPFFQSRCLVSLFAVGFVARAAGGPPPQSFFVEGPVPPGSSVKNYFLQDTPQSSVNHAQFDANGVGFARGAIRLHFADASPSVELCGAALLPGQVNYLLGQDAAVWRTGVPTYKKVVYRGLYPGINLTYTAANGVLKSEFTIGPGSSPSQIRLEYTGDVEIAPDGELIVHNGSAELREQALVIYQEDHRIVSGRFHKLDRHTVGFVIGDYDRALPLIIDPVISYSTYLGGTGQGAVTGLALDSAGNLYAAGWTEALNFPIAGAAQAANAGGVDAFVVKFNSTGSTLLYATYIGGRGDDRAAGIAVDSSGQAYVTGSTASGNFPVVQASQATLGGSRSAFALKLNAAGNALLYSTYLGGTNYEVGTAIAVDANGNAYVAGDTQSSNFPVMNAAQATLAGATDAFVAKLNSSGARVFSTFLGGSGNDHAGGIALDSSANVYVAGGTYSTNFPVAGAIRGTNGGSQDAFVTKLSASGSQILYSTYLGGNGALTPEQANAIVVDAAGSAYVTGATNSTNFPVTSGAYQTAFGGVQDAFVCKLNPAGNALVYSTYLGGTQFDWAWGIGLDASGNAYVAGYTASHDFAVVGGVQNGFGGAYDAFVSRITATGNSLGFSTYYGGSGSDVSNAIAVDASGNMFIGGQTSSLNLPLAGAIQVNNNGVSIGWVARLGVTAPPPQQPSAVSVTPSSGSGNSVVFTAQYSDTGGATQLTTVALLLNTSASTAYACYVSYNRSANTFSLANDDPATGGQTVIPGGGSQQNSQCQLNGAGSSASTSGSNLTLNVSLTFQPAYPGTKSVYLYAADAGANTGWVARGSWTVTVPPPQPSADSVSPNSGLGASGTFTFVFSDTQSAGNLTGMAMLFASSVRTSNACYIVFDRNAGTLALLWDSGAGSDSRPIGGATVLQNSQCAVGTASAQVAGLSEIVTLTITFKGVFSGAQNIYMFGSEGALNTGWVQRGTYTVAAGGVPVTGTMVPASGSGPSQRFSFTMADQGGASYLTGMAVLFASTFSTANACSLVYDRTANVVSLSYDNPAGGASSIAPGSSSVVSNSQCTLRGANTTVVIGTTSIVVTFDLSFNAAWFGPKNVYEYAAEPTANSGWVTVGSWTVTGGAPTADSVSPASGSGSSPSLTFTVSDSAAQANITGMSMMLTTGSPANSANACYLIYNRTNSTIGLYDDAVTALSTKGVGSSAALQNTQCAVGYTVMSISGNSVIFTVNLLLKPAFSGAKTVYIQANEPATNSGWVARGTWTVP